MSGRPRLLPLNVSQCRSPRENYHDGSAVKPATNPMPPEVQPPASYSLCLSCRLAHQSAWAHRQDCLPDRSDSSTRHQNGCLDNKAAIGTIVYCSTGIATKSSFNAPALPLPVRSLSGKSCRAAGIPATIRERPVCWWCGMDAIGLENLGATHILSPRLHNAPGSNRSPLPYCRTMYRM